MPNDYSEEYKTVAGSLTRGEIGFSIGAGMSKDCGIDLGAEMARRMLRRAVLGDGEENNSSHPELDELALRYPFEAITQYLNAKLPIANIAKWLLNEGGMNRARPATAHRKLYELYSLIPHRFPKALFTTNFDTLIEDAFTGGEAHCITSENLADLSDVRSQGRIAVVHLHGCVRHPKSIIIGEQVQHTIEGPIFDLLRGALATDVFVLVGYSLGDTNLRHVFFDVQRVAETRLGLNKRTFAVSPASGDAGVPSTPAGVANVVWKQRGVDHIPVSANDFFESVFGAADNFVTLKIREEVARALGKDPATLDQMLDSAAKPFGVIDPSDLLIYLYYTLSPLEKGS